MSDVQSPWNHRPRSRRIHPKPMYRKHSKRLRNATQSCVSHQCAIWSAHLFRFPAHHYGFTEEEVEHPPEAHTGFHKDYFKMQALKKDWIEQNPQVWQTSSSGSDATRPKQKAPWPPWADEADDDHLNEGSESEMVT